MSRGRSHHETRRIIWRKTKGRCAHCGRFVSPKNQTIDHYVPQSKGGTSDRRNLLPLCRTCNKARGNRNVNPIEFYEYAPMWAVQEALEYEREFNRKYKSMR